MNQIPTDPPARAGLRARFVAFCGKQWPRYFFLGFVGFIVRLPALQGQLIWDDGYLARDNPFIKSPLLALEAFRHYLFLDSLSGHYRPVQNLSFMVDYFFWNTDLAGFHLSNILLHVASGLLLFRLLTLLFQSGGGIYNNDDSRSTRVGALAAFLISAIWMVHPVHSAAIDYISGRADSLAFLFSAGAWLLVLRGRSAKSGSVKYLLYSLAGVAGVLALCSREIACIWAFIFLVHTLAFDKSVGRKSKITTTICCLLVLGAYAGLRQLPQARNENGANETWPAPVRVMLMLRALGDYSRLMIYPVNLHMERTIFEPNNYRSQDAWRTSASAEYLSVLGLAVFATFVCGCAKRGAGQQMRLLGAIWFLAGYLPISNIVQLNATVAEHWLYLPSVGFLIFLAGCIVDLPKNFGRAIAAVAALAIVALGARSAIRSSDWRDEEIFYKRTLAAGGTSPRVAVNLAQIYEKRGDYAEAEKIFRRVLQLTPDYPIAKSNLAYALAAEGKIAEAEILLAKCTQEAPQAQKEHPRTWIAALNLAHLRHKAKDDTEAIALLEHARAQNPSTWDLVSLESELLRQTQGPLPALHLVEDFVHENWWHHAARLAAGRLYAQNHDVAQSIRALRHAALLDVHDVEALNLLAQILVRGNQLDEAFAAQRRAVARQPYQPRQYLMLAEILDKMGRSAEARNALDQVARLQALVTLPRVAAN